jgi:3-oxoadipate enol-lactonase
VTPLVFLHGVGGGHDAWQRQVAHFRVLGYRCLAWDQPGYGGTPALEPYDLAQISQALKQYAQPHAPIVLIGHSMGGFIAQETYARFPELVRALVLCFTSAAFAGGTAFADQFIAARIGPLDEAKSMAEVAARVMPTMRGANSDPQGLALAERVMSQIPPETYRKAVKLLTRIRAPTLGIAGSDDTTAPAKGMRKMAQAIPGAEYVERCGRLGPMDEPEAFNRALADFLQRHSL